MNTAFLIARKQVGLTQDQLEDRTKVTQSDISRIELRGWTPPPDVSQRLAEALGVEVDTLFPLAQDRAS